MTPSVFFVLSFWSNQKSGFDFFSLRRHYKIRREIDLLKREKDGRALHCRVHHLSTNSETGEVLFNTAENNFYRQFRLQDHFGSKKRLRSLAMFQNKTSPISSFVDMWGTRYACSHVSNSPSGLLCVRHECTVVLLLAGRCRQPSVVVAF